MVVADTAASDLVKLAEVVGARVLVEPDGAHRVRDLGSAPWDLAVVSPGVAPADPVILHLRAAGVDIWSDLELAWRLRDKSGEPAEWIMVHQDEETDVAVDLALRIFQAASVPARVVGYGAPPVLDALREPRPYDALIVQVSRESLVWRVRYPNSVISPALTVSLQAEGEDTSGVFFDGTARACVYRKGVGPTESQVHDADVVEGARAIGIGLDSPGMSDIGLVEGIIVDRAFLDDRAHQALEISTLEEIQEAGWDVPRQLPSLLAAIAITRSRDVSPALIAGVLSLP
jgi:UDP-N-acetylmuramoylalanine--D-glutamate ligase